MSTIHAIDSLYPGFPNLLIRVKILQVWEDGVGNRKVLKFVIADGLNGKIHGHVPNSLINQFSRRIVKLSWVLMEDFIVRHDYAECKATKNPLKIVFTTSTYIRHSRIVDEDMNFDFADFAKINTREEESEHYVDLIGTAINVGSLQTVYRNLEHEDYALLEVDLRDQNGVVVECFVVGLAAWNFLYDWQHQGGDRNVCILRFWCINYLNPIPKVYNREKCGEIIFNPNFRDIQEIRGALIARAIAGANEEIILSDDDDE